MAVNWLGIFPDRTGRYPPARMEKNEGVGRHHLLSTPGSGFSGHGRAPELKNRAGEGQMRLRQQQPQQRLRVVSGE